MPSIGGGIRRIGAVYKILGKLAKDLTVVTAEPGSEKFEKVLYIKQVVANKSNVSVNFMNNERHEQKIKILNKAFLFWLPKVLLGILYKKFDYIYATCPVFENVLAGYVYKLFHFNKPKLIVEYRDMYSYDPANVKNCSLRFMNKIENFILKRCDLVIVTTEGMKEILYNELKIKNIKLVRNYMSDNDFCYMETVTKVNLDHNYFHIGYVGKLNLGRNPQIILNILKNTIEGKQLMLHFVGITEKEFLQLKEIGNDFSDRLVYHGIVSRLESLKYMKSFDANFILVNPNAKISDGYGIPGKLYDYIGAGKKIISDSSTYENLKSEFNIDFLPIDDNYVFLNFSSFENNFDESFIKVFNDFVHCN